MKHFLLLLLLCSTSNVAKMKQPVGAAAVCCEAMAFGVTYAIHKFFFFAVCERLLCVFFCFILVCLHEWQIEEM